MKLISGPCTRVTDMTSGEPLKLILLFAIPLFIGNVFQQIYTVVDTAMHAMGSRIAPVLSSFVELAVKAVGANALIPKLGYLGACVTEPATWVIMTLFPVVSYSFIRKRLFIK